MLLFAASAYTVLMLGLHISSRWLVPRLLLQPRRCWSARWLLRFELGYYVLLGAFAFYQPARIPLWAAVLFGTLHLAAWAAGERHPALSSAIAWTPQLARRVNEIFIFDLAEAAFLLLVALRLMA